MARASSTPIVRRASTARTARWAWLLLVGLAAACWLAVGRLGIAFWRSSLDWTYVAEQSRVDAPWYYRVAGVWGAMEGSLLLFTAIVATAMAIAARRAPVAVVGGAVVTVATLLVTNLAIASPFGRQDVPSTTGFGLNPILEHPAMAIHPPLLYVGLASAGGAAVAALAVHPERSWPAARPWLLATLAALTAAMALGGAWSYVEQGWGGYWAWDPVENTSLLVWITALVALHLAPRARPPVALASLVTPWLLAMLGAALVRSGRTPSVHGFARRLAVGWVLFGLFVATAVAVTVAVVRSRRAMSDEATGRTHRSSRSDPRGVMVALASVAAIVVLVGTLAPVITDLADGRAAAVRGDFYSRTVGPLALVAVPFLALRLRRLRPATSERTARRWSTVAHAGMLVMLAGIAASTFDEVATEPVAAGETISMAGVEVRNEAVDVGPGPRVATEGVTARLLVDGHEMRPRIVVYPDRGGRLAEVAVRTGPFTDTQALLEGAQDDGSIVVTVHRRHGMWLVWLGAAAVTMAALGAASVRTGGRTTRRNPT